MKNTCNYTDINNYYNPKLIAGSLEENYKIYRINGDKNKKISLNDYINTIRPNFNELITKKKINKSKVQLAISIIFLKYTDNDTADKYILSDNVIIRPTDDTN